jgi:hypothetical protein
MAAKKVKKQYHASVWEYADWLFLSGRLTAEECLTLKKHILDLEQDLRLAVQNEGC